MRCTPADSFDDRTENEPAPLTVLTRLPSSEKTTLAILRPRTVAFTLRPTQPEGPRSRERPETTSCPSTPVVGLGSTEGVAVGGTTAGGLTGGGLTGGC